MEQVLIPSKIRIIYIAMFLMAILLVAFSFRWQVIEASRFAEAAGERVKDAVIPSLRGTIYASDGSTLAYSEPRYDVNVWIPGLLFAERKELQTRDEFVGKVAPLIDMTPERLKQIILEYSEQGLTYPRVAKAVDIDTHDQLLALTRETDEGSILGVDMTFTSRRIYPEGRLCSQVLGLSSILESGETLGQGGLEGEWDGYLEPQIGFIQGETDAVGNAISLASEKTIEAKRGSSIYTTIDKNLQNIVEEKLKWAVDNYGAKSGTVIIIEPTTGYILALANFPDYDPNLREEKDVSVYGNKAVSEPYEIGSVGKVLTLASAIDAGVVKPQTVILEGHNGCEKIHEDLEPVCTHDKQPQPAMAIKDAFALSDNIYFLRLAELIEDHQEGLFYDYLDKFGIGKPTGVDLVGESFGYLLDSQYWNIGDIAAYSYGHSYQANAVQAISAVATVANYGTRMQPRIVKTVLEADGSEIEFKPRPVEQVVSKDTALQMDEMMHVIYQNNLFFWEHHYDDLRNYKIALKSGTALIPNETGGYSDRINATYVGYDASPHRTFAMITRLEDPAVGNLSSQNSRHLWLEIFKDIRGYLAIPRIGEF